MKLVERSRIERPLQPSLLPSICSTVVGLARALWRIIVAVKNRSELSRLDDLDDHMLADIGLTRDDLRAARLEPFWRDPSETLRARQRPVTPRSGVWRW